MVCMRCGVCQAVCPLFAQTGREADVARGKLALLDGLRYGMFMNSKGVFERLNRCLLCGSCEANCPGGVNVIEIFIKARAILADFMGLSPLKKAVLRGILACPETFNHLIELGSSLQRLFIRPANKLLGTSSARLVSSFIGNRHFKPLAPLPFHRTVPFLNTDRHHSSLKVAFFVGCLIDKVFPHIAQATVDVLSHHNVGIFIPEELGCCGIPAILSGDTIAFDRLVRYNMKRLDAVDIDYLVTSCATCAFAIRKIWPAMVQKDPSGFSARVKVIAEKTMDINQFLVSEFEIKKMEGKNDGNTAVLTYHDPCHLKKCLGVSAEPRTLIKANPAYRLKEMPEADWCCGLGGSFNLQHYKISASIGKQKRNNIKASGCSVVATGCPACMIQISDILSKSKDRIVVKHSIEIYAESFFP